MAIVYLISSILTIVTSLFELILSLFVTVGFTLCDIGGLLTLLRENKEIKILEINIEDLQQMLSQEKEYLQNLKKSAVNIETPALSQVIPLENQKF